MEFVIPPPPPRILPSNLPASSTSRAAQAAEALAEQPRLEKSSELDRLISYLFLRKEAVESSRMEGTLSTIEHVLTPGELLDGWKTKSEGASVRGYAHARLSRSWGGSRPRAWRSSRLTWFAASTMGR